MRRQTALHEQQTQLISSLALQVKQLSERVQRLETPSAAPAHAQPETNAAKPTSTVADAKRFTPARTQSRPKTLAPVWYEWFCDLLPFAHQNRRRYRECKVAVSFMRIFLPKDYNVAGNDDEAKARILRSGREAEVNIRKFLAAENIKSKITRNSRQGSQKNACRGQAERSHHKIPAAAARRSHR